MKIRSCFLFVLTLIATGYLYPNPSVEEANDALDLQLGSEFHASGTNSMSIVADAVAGPTSLALTLTSENTKNSVALSIFGPLDQNSLVEFWIKERNIGRYFTLSAFVNSEKIYANSSTPVNEAGWRKVSYLVLAGQGSKLSLSFRLRSDEPNDDAALLIDNFKVTPGNALQLEPGFGGNILASLSRSTFQAGETVTVTAQPKPGYRFDKFSIKSEDRYAEQNPARQDYSPELLTSDSINLLMRTHMTVSAAFHAQIPCEGAEAWSLNPNYEALEFDPKKPEDQITRARIEQLRQPGILSFELSALKPGKINLTFPDDYTAEQLQVSVNASNSSFVKVQIPFDAAPGTVEMQFMDGDHARVMKLRNLRYLTAPETVVSAHGLGEVVREEIPTSESGIQSASFTAEPAEGWVFIGWKNLKDGPFFSRENSIVLEQTRPRSLIATFGEAYQTESLSLVFVHDGSTTLAPVENTEGYTAISLSFDHDDEYSYVFSEEISVYARNMPTGTIEWRQSHRTPLLAQPQSTSSELFFITDTLQSQSHNPTEFQFRLAPYQEPSYALAVTADSHTFTQSQTNYALYEIANLSVKEDFRADFKSWQGDIVSSNPNVQVTVTKNLNIAAYFEFDGPFESPILLKWRSPYQFVYQNQGGHLLSPLSGDFASTLSGHADGPCRLKFRIIGDASVYLKTPTSNNSVHLQYGGPDNSTELRVLIEEAGDFSLDFSGSILDLQLVGVYQSVTAQYGPSGGSVVIEDWENSERLVGSTVNFTVDPDANHNFVGWQSPQLPADATSTTVKLFEDINFVPKFDHTLGVPTAIVPPETLDDWDYNPNYQGFELRNSPIRGESHPFKFSTGELGLLRFRLGANLLAEVFLDGEPIDPRRNFSLSENTFLHQVPVPAGSTQVEIHVRASTEVGLTHYSADLYLAKLEFLPGYAILEGLNANPDYPFTVSPTAPGNVYPPGSKVTLRAPTIEYNSFDRWSGDISGTASSIEVTLDRHLSVTPIYRPTKSISPSSLTVSSGSNVFALPHEWEQPLMVRGALTPNVLTFTIPAGQELQIETEGKLETSMIWKVSGEPNQEKFAGSIVAAPPSSQQRSATLTINIPVDSSEFVKLYNFQTRNRFLLGGDFGLNSGDVLVSPYKENYAWGEQVTISLGSSFPSSSRFYDLMTFRSSYDKTEWPSSDFVREYKVSINGDTFVIGNIGSTFTRTKGQVTTIPKTAIRSSSERDPLGGTSRQIDPSSICRIHADGSKFIRFYLKVPEGDTVYFDSLVSGIEIPIEGVGEWMQVGVPVPAGRDFVTFSLIDGGSYGDTSYISQVAPLSGYAPPFLSFGPGVIEIEPAQGVATPSSDVTLRAIPDTEDVFHLWLTPSENEATSIVAPPMASFPIFSYFESITIDPEPISDPLPWGLEANVEPFNFENTDTRKRITLYKDTVELTKTITGPGVLVLTIEARYDNPLTIQIGEETFSAPWPEYHYGEKKYYYPIPEGSHPLSILFDPQGTYTTSKLTKLEVVDGYILNIDDSETPVIPYPKKPYYATGETVTVLANPLPGFNFESWTGTATSDANPLTPLVMSQHHMLRPTITSSPITAVTGEEWTPIETKSNRYTYETLLEGPGTLYLNVGIKDFPSLQIDGMPNAARPHDANRSYFLIPDGKHRVRLDQNRNLAAAPSTYIPGYKVDISAEVSGRTFSITPQQLSFEKGDQVTIDWPTELPPPPEHIPFFLQPEGTTVSLPHTFTVKGHHVGQLFTGIPAPIENFFYTSLFDLFDSTYETSFLGGNDILEGLDVSFLGRALHLQLKERGILTFSFRGIPSNEYTSFTYSLKLNGETILHLVDGQSYSINIPQGENLLTWLPLDSDLWLADTSHLDALTFTPAPLADPFRDQLELSVPLAQLATSNQLLPDQDLDGDGIDNQTELTKTATPGHYDLPIWIHRDELNLEQIVTRFLTTNPFAKDLAEPPTTCIEFITSPEYNPGHESDLYALTFLPQGISPERLALQVGTLDDETGQTYWNTVATASATALVSPTNQNGTLIRLKLDPLASTKPLIRFKLTEVSL